MNLMYYYVVHTVQGGKTRTRYYNLTNGLNMKGADILEFARKTAFHLWGGWIVGC